MIILSIQALVKDTKLKLKNKIYLLQLFIAFSFVAFFILFYNGYINQKEKDLQNNIKTVVATNKLYIEKALELLYDDYQSNQKLFYDIHQYGQNEYLKNPSQNGKSFYI